MVRSSRILSVAVAIAVSVALLQTSCRAESTRSLVAKGNKHYGKGSFGEALEYYDKASIKAPESEIIAFNKGTAYYKQGDYANASERFKEAASKTKSLPFEAKAWYNLGNVAFKEAERQEDSDLRQALASLEESVKRYMTALEKDPNLEEAAKNLEIARLKIKDLLDRMKKQEQRSGSAGSTEPGNEERQKQKNEQESMEGEDLAPGETARQDSSMVQEQSRKKQQSPEPKERQKGLAPDETARQILDEERENRKQRAREEARTRYRPVEKDW